MFDGSNVNLFVAFAGGVVTFFASCLLPLVPTYLAYLTGSAKKNTLLNSLFFTLGFISVFVLLGLTANIIGNFFSLNRGLIQKIGGVFLVFVGFFMLDIIKLPFLYKEKRFEFDAVFKRWKKARAFLFGVTFGFAWTPCVGPVLSVILLWASQADTAARGVLLLLVYGLGLGLPFILIGLFFDTVWKYVQKFSKFTVILNKLSAGLIILTGILLVLEKLGHVTFWFLKIFNIHSFSV